MFVAMLELFKTLGMMLHLITIQKCEVNTYLLMYTLVACTGTAVACLVHGTLGWGFLVVLAVLDQPVNLIDHTSG